jgi:dTDP-4-amino-4,6-dideoxygalactose transaminase
MHAPVSTAVDATAFSIGFDQRDRARLHELWDEVLDSGRWSEGPVVDRLERTWGSRDGLEACAFAGWSGGALAALAHAGVAGETVLCPSNTFMATPLAILAAGAKPAFVDCNREDLCVSFEDFEREAERLKPRAAFVVHIGGHIAFEIERIAAYCRDNGIFLIEDCAHAHGASWNGKRPGSYGDAGIYSLYATKTISTGEGGMLVSANRDVVDFARDHRNYGKPDYEVRGLGQRMNEFTAALGLVQIERLDEIVGWKNEVARRHLDSLFASSRLELPEGMVSGLYKYVVFEPLERSTGRVYDEPCHRVLGSDRDLPNTDWVAANHSCVPLYYHGPGVPEDNEGWASLKEGS